MKNGDAILLLVATALFSALLTRKFWPVIELKTETKFVSPKIADVNMSVAYFAFNPNSGEVVFGPNGVILNREY